MKTTKALFLTIALISIFLSSCSSSSDEKKVLTFKEESKMEVNTSSNPSSPNVSTDSISYKDEQVMLAKIANIMNPEQAWEIYMDNNGNEVERVAYARWETLMKTKIASITDPEQAHRIYMDNNGNEVERVAYARWETLMKTKIASITDPEQAHRIYMDNNGNEVERVAYARYKALGGKK